MEKSFSWQGYWVFIAIIVLVYYAAIILLYFKTDLFVLIGLGKRENSNKSLSSSLSTYVSSPTEMEENSNLVFDALLNELDAFFQTAKTTKCNKGQILHFLSLLLQKYPRSIAGSYRETIINIIIAHFQNSCSLSLTSNEVSKVWLE